MPGIDEKIKAQREHSRQRKQELEDSIQALRELFQEKAQATCPIAIGTKVEYAPRKFGQVDRIGYEVDFLNELSDAAEVHWTVEGRKFKGNGEYGVKDFKPVGPATHFVNGTSFEPKDIAAILGIAED